MKSKEYRCSMLLWIPLLLLSRKVTAKKKLRMPFSTLPTMTAFFMHQQRQEQRETSVLSNLDTTIMNDEPEIEFEFGEQEGRLDEGERGTPFKEHADDDDDDDDDDFESTVGTHTSPRATVISPSLLACDWSCIRDEVYHCLRAGANRLHIDIFDGVYLDSPQALTFGPQMVAAIRKSCCNGDDSAILDLHMCVHRPARYVAAMAAAGATRFIFSWESVGSLDEAIDLAFEIASSGMACGVSINPSTNVEEIFPLLETNMVDCVDVLAVEPGFGGQKFQKRALEAIARLRALRSLSMIDFDIMVDGGINHETAGEAVFAGADILVSGSFLFGHPGGIYLCMVDLLGEAQRYMQG